MLTFLLPNINSKEHSFSGKCTSAVLKTNSPPLPVTDVLVRPAFNAVMRIMMDSLTCKRPTTHPSPCPACSSCPPSSPARCTCCCSPGRSVLRSKAVVRQISTQSDFVIFCLYFFCDHCWYEHISDIGNGKNNLQKASLVWSQWAVSCLDN